LDLLPGTARDGTGDIRAGRRLAGNFRSIGDMLLKPGVLTVISGENGVGKTSVLLAIEACLCGGHTPNLIRHGAKSAEVVMTLDNGTTICKKITEKASTLTITTADGLEVPKPQAFVETLAGGFASDPLSFVDAKPKERLAYLQRALNISFLKEEIAEACAMKPPAPVDLDGLELIRKQVYEMRTKENTLAKQADGTVQRLSATLADDEATDWKAELARIQAERDKAQQEISGRRQQVTTEAAAARTEANRDADAKIREIDAERTRQLAAIAIEEKAAFADIDAQSRPAMDALTAQLATAQERAKRAAQNKGWRQEIETSRAAADDHKAASASLTLHINAIDALKKQKLDSLPIPGVDLKDGEFYCGGIPFDDLNTGEQFIKAFQIGSLQPGQLGIMIADRAETLGPENWQAFQDAALASGYQIFATRVTGGPLDVRSISAEKAVTA
jgi:hypothetical protein